MAASLKPYLDCLDFQAMEAVLSAGIRECIENVARDRFGEEFVGFALDCNSRWGRFFSAWLRRVTYRASQRRQA
ncbi:hypothetical protein [Chitinimonas lacunae]|uniref:Uncharacterized protein n=1 Tax=Chitinimonas lacunae TaxID=1963018 RepID=A0ABV8MUY6_9NEIS